MSDRAELDRLKRDARIDRVVAYLLNEQGRRVTADQLAFFCPFHQDRKTPNLHVHPTKNGGVYKCRTCDAEGDVFTFVSKYQSLEFPETLEWIKRHIGELPATTTSGAAKAVVASRRMTTTGGGGSIDPSAPPITLDELAAAKSIPADALRGFGLQDVADKGVWIPYLMPDGTRAPRQRLRTALRAGDGSRWNSVDGDLVPYGLERLSSWRGTSDYLVIVEGESDAWTCWYADIPAIGLPGAQTAKTLQAEYLQGFRAFIVTREPDRGGAVFEQKVPERIRELVPDAQVHVLPMPDGCKDVNAWYRRDGERFGEEFRSAVLALLNTQSAASQSGGESAPAPGSSPPTSRDTTAAPSSKKAPKQAAILDDAPAEIARPLCIVEDHAYAATWVYLDTNREQEQLVLIRDDGTVFCNVLLHGGRPLAELGLTVHLPHLVHRRYRWSGKGVNAYLRGKRPDPAEVFRSLTRVVNHHVCFVRSLGEQDVMAELQATYALSTWFLEAFDVAGYLWFAGEKGSGKTWALKTVAQVAFLGTQLLAGSSLPALRDISDYGGLIGLDDAENVTDPDKFDEDKRALFLSGNQRGGYIAVKEPAAGNKKGWVTRFVNIFSPRIFSSIRNPDATLASRCIQVPMCRASVNLPDPMNEAQWPISRSDLIDDMWAVGLANLQRLRALDAEVIQHTDLVGRTLQPWRSVLTVALWLERDCGVVGLLEHMTKLSQSYQRERDELEKDDPVRVAITCIGEMLGEQSSSSALVFKTGDLTERMNKIGQDHDLADTGKEFTNTRRVGKMLSRLRFERPINLPGPRRWQVTRPFYRDLSFAHGVNGHGPVASSSSNTIPIVNVSDDPDEPFSF